MRNWTVALSLLALIIAGCGAPSLLITPISNRNDLIEQEVQPAKAWTYNKIVIIPVEGMISNARSPGFLQPGENPVSLLAQQLRRAEEDSSVKAIVLRVNSPGGTVTASDSVYEMLRGFRTRTGKPVIASVQEVGASGAYYVACSADQIVAQPTSVVGSIGVIFTTFDVVGTMDKIGVRSYAIKSGELKDMGSLFKPMTPAEHQVIQDLINQYFARFRSIVQTKPQAH